MVAAAVPIGDQLPSDLAAKIADLATMDDDGLWRMARTHMSPAAVRSLAALNAKQQREGLSTEEAVTLAELVRQYETAMLVRARAAALLRQRGHDIASLLTPPA